MLLDKSHLIFLVYNINEHAVKVRICRKKCRTNNDDTDIQRKNAKDIRPKGDQHSHLITTSVIYVCVCMKRVMKDEEG